MQMSLGSYCGPLTAKNKNLVFTRDSLNLQEVIIYLNYFHKMVAFAHDLVNVELKSMTFFTLLYSIRDIRWLSDFTHQANLKITENFFKNGKAVLKSTGNIHTPIYVDVFFKYPFYTFGREYTKIILVLEVILQMS